MPLGSVSRYDNWDLDGGPLDGMMRERERENWWIKKSRLVNSMSGMR